MISQTNTNDQQTWPLHAEHAVQDLASQVKSTAGELLETVNEHTDHAQDKANQLIQKLKMNVDALLNNGEEYAEKTGKKAYKLNKELQQNVKEHWKLAKENSRKTVQMHPVGTVVIAASAGLLLGYLLSKYSDE